MHAQRVKQNAVVWLRVGLSGVMPGPPTQHSQGHKNGLKSKLAILDQALVLVKLVRMCASSEVHGWCIGVHWPKAQTLGFCPLGITEAAFDSKCLPKSSPLASGRPAVCACQQQREPGCDGRSHYVARLWGFVGYHHNNDLLGVGMLFLMFQNDACV